VRGSSRTTLGGYFDNLIGAMKAGVPKIRDRQGGHGAAPGDDPVPDHIAAFVLHLTAANIVMLVKAHRAIERSASAWWASSSSQRIYNHQSG
jgi:hypothetical protein